MRTSRIASRTTRRGLPTRRALTLVEMLVSLVCVILLMLAYTQLFSSVSTRIADARSMIELTNRMRGVANQLRTDLAGHTCDLLPPGSPQSGDGYFEYVEGPLHDKPLENGMVVYDIDGEREPDGDDDDAAFIKQLSFLGDSDDVLMFTTRCKNGAFTGRYWIDSNGDGIVQDTEIHQVQSTVAEVVWFLRPTLLVDPSSSANAMVPASPPTFTLYRRAYLVMPTYQGNPTVITASPPTGALKLPDPAFYQNNDLSVHYDLNSGSFAANTLGDLAKRECRYGHAFNPVAPSNGFPHRIDPKYLVPFGGILNAGAYSIDRTNSRYGEDVVLTNVVSFDVQAYDPTAPVYNAGPVAIGPSDVGFKATPSIIPGTIPSFPPLYAYPLPDSIGAFADLNWSGRGKPYNNYFPIRDIAIPNPCNPATKYHTTIGEIPLSGTDNCNLVPMSPFYSMGHPRSQLVAAGGLPSDIYSGWMNDDKIDANGLPNYSLYKCTPATYDTWSTHYEHDGLDQDLPLGDTHGPDQGGMGVAGTVPETSPPYPVPLRGIKITIRCYEPDSRQMHEISVVESFVPE